MNEWTPSGRQQTTNPLVQAELPFLSCRCGSPVPLTEPPIKPTVDLLLDNDPHYCQPTKSSLSRSRSPSPTRRLASLDLADTIDPRPPFVVRKVSLLFSFYYICFVVIHCARLCGKSVAVCVLDNARCASFECERVIWVHLYCLGYKF
jgi:hypothetical protein